VAELERDALMARMASTRVNRRSFLAAAGLMGGSAALAACSSGPGTSAAPSAAASTGGEASAAPSADAGGDIEEELWMLNWSGYVDPANMESFKAEYGVKNFQYDIFANNDELLAKLAGGATGYDMACPTADYIPAMVEGGFLQKLDYTRIPNFKYIDPSVLSQPWDPNNEYHVPKDFGTTGILYRSKIVTEPVTSWKEFFDLSVGKYSGKVVLVDSMSDVIVVMRDGRILQQGDPTELYERPTNRFVADFLGSSNFIPATVQEFDSSTRRAVVRSDRGLALRGVVTDPAATPGGGDAVTVATRPERLEVHRTDDAASAGDAGWTELAGRIQQGTYLGDHTEYRVVTDQAGELIVRRQNTVGTGSALGGGPGDSVVVRWHEEANLILAG